MLASTQSPHQFNKLLSASTVGLLERPIGVLPDDPVAAVGDEVLALNVAAAFEKNLGAILTIGHGLALAGGPKFMELTVVVDGFAIIGIPVLSL